MMLEGCSPIALDIGAGCVKAVQTRRDGARWKLAAWACFERRTAGAAMDEQEAARIVSVLERRGFVGHRAVVLAPAGAVRVVELELPAGVSGGAREGIARMEAARITRLDPFSFELGVWDLPKPARAGSASLAAAVLLPHAEASAIIDPLQRAGLTVVGVNAAAAALARSCGGWLGGDAASPSIDVILDCGFSGATVIVVVGRVVVYERRLTDATLSAAVDAVAAAMQIERGDAMTLMGESLKRDGGGDGGGEGRLAMPDAVGKASRRLSEQMRGEVEVSLEYAWHRYPEASPGKLILVGGGATLHGLMDAPSCGSDLAPVVVRLDHMIDAGTDAAAARSPMFAGAIGLACGDVCARRDAA